MEQSINIEIQSENQEQQQEQPQQQEQKEQPIVNSQHSLSREEGINRMLKKGQMFQKETEQRIKVAPNVPLMALFYKDFYLERSELVDEQIAVYHKEPQEAAAYAEAHYRIKRKLEDDPNDPKRKFPRTTYRIRLPYSDFPDLERELAVSSKNAVDAIEGKLAEIGLKPENADKEILLTILKVDNGNIYKTKWEVSGQVWDPKS
jgi:hypothetical protein